LLSEEVLPPGRALAIVLRYYRHYREGFLPRAGGVGEQPAFLLECLEACADAQAEHEALKRQEQETSSPGKGPRRVGRLSAEDAAKPDWHRRVKPN